MPTSDAGMTDPIDVSLNGVAVSTGRDPEGAQSDLPSLGSRPSDTAAKPRWIDYAVGLGLDRDLAGTWTKNDLIAWCDGED